MRVVNQLAVVDREKCKGCATCVKVCPVIAIEIENEGGKRSATINQQECQACTICMTRCPEGAITMNKRQSPLLVGEDFNKVAPEKVEDICRKAHMYPSQIVCYCHRIQAKEIVAAILLGAKTPEEIAKKTGARTGCGVLCITGVIRLLKSAGIDLNRAPGYQWYGNIVTIWDLPEDVMQKYDQEYYLLQDRKNLDKIFPGGEND